MSGLECARARPSRKPHVLRTRRACTSHDRLVIVTVATCDSLVIVTVMICDSYMTHLVTVPTR